MDAQISEPWPRRTQSRACAVATPTGHGRCSSHIRTSARSLPSDTPAERWSEIDRESTGPARDGALAKELFSDDFPQDVVVERQVSHEALEADNDRALNQGVQRFDADPAALREISRHYPTSGRLKVPLVTMHTLGDPIVPYWHETLYNAKALFGGSALKHVNLPIVRYGHCTFTTQEAQYAFALLVRMVTGAAPAGMEEVMPTPEMQQGDVRLFQEYQSLPAYPR